MEVAIREERFSGGPTPLPPGARSHALTGLPGLGAVHVKVRPSLRERISRGPGLLSAGGCRWVFQAFCED